MIIEKIRKKTQFGQQNLEQFLQILQSRQSQEILGPDWLQRCGIVTIFYGSGSDFWKVMVPVPTFEKLWFRFRFLLLKKITVPVPVPAPYLDHKKQIFQKKFWKKFCLFT